MKFIESDNKEAESENESDSDTCDRTEINKIFNLKCNAVTNKTVNKRKYILNIDGTISSTPNIIIGLSGNTAEVYNLGNNQLAKLHTIVCSENIIGVKACTENENLFYIGSKNCEIQILDLRDTNSKTYFKDTTLEVETNKYKPLNCFDVASNNVLLGGGTDRHAGDAYILFWDIRNSKLLGAYWDSHTDDVTQVKFHPTDANKLISGSTDGLINIFDLSQSSEDDALIDSLNTESSIEQLRWYSENNVDMIGCVIHTTDVQTWRLEDVQPFAHFRKDAIAKELRRKLEDYCYVASLQVNKNNNLVALVGSNYENGECLRVFGVDKKNLLPLFNVSANKQRIRCSWLNKNGDILATGGESGTIDIWSVQTNFATSSKRK